MRFILILVAISMVFLTVIGFEMKYINDFQIAPDFNLQEFVSPDTQEVKIDSRLVTIVQLIRYRMGCEVIVTSGYRTEEYNRKIGGALHSLHMEGLAADLSPKNHDLVRLFKIAAEFEEIRGLGIYERHVHIDLRETERLIWVCLKGKYYYYTDLRTAIRHYQKAT